jgi:hypothetical protein
MLMFTTVVASITETAETFTYSIAMFADRGLLGYVAQASFTWACVPVYPSAPQLWIYHIDLMVDASRFVTTCLLDHAVEG